MIRPAAFAHAHLNSNITLIHFDISAPFSMTCHQIFCWRQRDVPCAARAAEAAVCLIEAEDFAAATRFSFSLPFSLSSRFYSSASFVVLQPMSAAQLMPYTRGDMPRDADAA